MRKLIPLIFVTILMASCSSERKQQAITESQADAKVDSIVGERMNDLFMQAMEDRDRRISIEVKPKADSIFDAWKAAGGN